MESFPRLLASIMRLHFARTALAAILALAAPLALADVYTWTDASGRLNVSNLPPPDGVHVESVVHEEPPKVSPGTAAARDAARSAEMQALNDRVSQLQDELDRAKQQPALPPVVYRAAPPAPPVQLTVNVMPSTPPEGSAPGYAGYRGYGGYGGYPGYFPYPGYPGLPYDYCDPTIFGCPAFGYPVGVVVLNTPHGRGFKRFDRQRGGQHFTGMRPPPVRSAYNHR